MLGMSSPSVSRRHDAALLRISRDPKFSAANTNVIDHDEKIKSRETYKSRPDPDFKSGLDPDFTDFTGMKDDG